MYDPSHPDADWSGYVPALPTKKRFEGPPCKWKQGRGSGAIKSSSFDLTEGDPYAVGTSNWQTETQSASVDTKTTMISQLTENGRKMKIRGKKMTLPAYENVRPFDESVAMRLRDENPYELSDRANGGGKANTSANSIDAKATNDNQDGSFLDGLGKELVSTIPSVKHISAPAPFATQGDLPTDPYATSDGGRRKDLLFENYYKKHDC